MTREIPRDANHVILNDPDHPYIPGEPDVAPPGLPVAATRLVREIRAIASRLPFDQRAILLRNLVCAVRDAVKFDPLVGGCAPDGTADELDRMAEIGTAAENYRDYVREVLLREDGRL